MSSGRHCNHENNSVEPQVTAAATTNGATKERAVLKPPPRSHQQNPPQPERTTKIRSCQELLDSGLLDADQWLRVCEAAQVIRQGDGMIREGERLVSEGERKKLQVEGELEVEREREKAGRPRESKVVLDDADNNTNNSKRSASVKTAKTGSDGLLLLPSTQDIGLLEDEFARKLRLPSTPDQGERGRGRERARSPQAALANRHSPQAMLGRRRCRSSRRRDDDLVTEEVTPFDWDSVDPRKQKKKKSSRQTRSRK